MVIWRLVGETVGLIPVLGKVLLLWRKGLKGVGEEGVKTAVTDKRETLNVVSSKGQKIPVCNAEGKRNWIFDSCSQGVNCLIFGWYLYWSALGCLGGSEDGFVPVMVQWHKEVMRPGSTRYVRQRWAKQGRLISPRRRQAQLRLSLGNKGSYGHTRRYLAVTYLCALQLLGCLRVPSGESSCTSPGFLFCSYARAAAGFPCWGKQKWTCV